MPYGSQRSVATVPYRRRRATKRIRGGLRYPLVRRSSYSRGISTGISNKVFTFIRSNPMWTQLPDSGTGVAAQMQFGSISFTLSQISGHAELTALFDEYRINWLKLTFSPLVAPQASTTGAGTQANPTHPFYTAIDYNDSAAPATMTALGEYSSCVTHEMNGKPFTVFLRPHILTMVYESLIATSYSSTPTNRVWLCTVNNAIPHYGVKWGFMGTNPAVAFVPAFNVSAEFSISCKFSK